MFHGYDFDSTMLPIGSMNMLMHGVEGAGSLYYKSTTKDVQRVVKTKKTELLFLALYHCLPG